jgi:hypothetical protein
VAGSVALAAVPINKPRFCAELEVVMRSSRSRGINRAVRMAMQCADHFNKGKILFSKAR